jgi:hypothetical protein
VCGYLALGNDVPASIVLGFDSAPIWVTLLANFMVLVHMVPAYQVRMVICRVNAHCALVPASRLGS